MFSVEIIAVGKLKERFYADACAEYVKRLNAFCAVHITELPEGRSRSEEANRIFEKIPKNAYVFVFTPEGKKLSSEAFAQHLRTLKTDGVSTACFIIGSSEGLDDRVKAKADFRLSVSDMTFPHHLFRVMALEQIYRAESIQAGTRYHK